MYEPPNSLTELVGFVTFAAFADFGGQPRIDAVTTNFGNIRRRTLGKMRLARHGRSPAECPNGSETVPISISRQAHLCAALSNRMGISDICALQAAVPTSAQSTTLTIAGSVAADAFSRGSQTPVTPAYPDLFYRAASEELCENVAKLVVDATGGPYTSSSSSCADGDGLMTKLVEQVMGIAAGDPIHDQALMTLENHCGNAAKVKTSGGGSAQTNAVRSTFVLACESPTSLGIGL